jgi:uncharacterized RDD family membrane protein YckC
MSHAAEPVDLPRAGLARRFAAMLYDGLLLAALLMVVTVCFLPFTGGEAVTWRQFPLLAVLHRLACILAIVAYCGLPWTQRGQTLGMTTWRLRVQRNDGYLLTWRDVVQRLAASLLSWIPAGLGWWWALFDRERRTWHDALSRTRVVVLPKRAKAKT